MYNNLLAKNEMLRILDNGERELETKLTAYQVYVEEGIDKDGNKILNSDNTTRYFAIDDDEVFTVTERMQVKKISDNFFKKVLKIEGEDTLIERITQKEDKVVYYPIKEDMLTFLEPGMVLRKLRHDC